MDDGASSLGILEPDWLISDWLKEPLPFNPRGPFSFPIDPIGEKFLGDSFFIFESWSCIGG